MATSSTLSVALYLISFSLLFSFSTATPRMLVLVQQQPLVLKYHNGPLLKGNFTVNILWYGRFSPTQRAIIGDFINSLSPATKASPAPPSVASWWTTTSLYRAGSTIITLGRQLLDESFSKGKILTSTDLAQLAAKLQPSPTTISVVLTAQDVAVEGFCSSRCGTHASLSRSPYIWVGNSATQCPGQCAWPFHQPIYGPQTPPLVAPNGDVGMDGMVINLATVLAGTVTNPDGRGYFQGPASAPLEAVSACTGTFGPGAYAGYPGRVLTNPATGASYNALGLDGRNYLLTAMWDPKTSQCATLV